MQKHIYFLMDLQRFALEGQFFSHPLSQFVLSLKIDQKNKWKKYSFPIKEQFVCVLKILF